MGSLAGFLKSTDLPATQPEHPGAHLMSLCVFVDGPKVVPPKLTRSPEGPETNPSKALMLCNGGSVTPDPRHRPNRILREQQARAPVLRMPGCSHYLWKSTDYKVPSS